jgi:hypothetical protein
MSIAEEHRDQLGDWITRRLRKGVEQYNRRAIDILRDCDTPIKELREEWAAQKEAQLSVRERMLSFPFNSIDSSLISHWQ